VIVVRAALITGNFAAGQGPAHQEIRRAQQRSKLREPARLRSLWLSQMVNVERSGVSGYGNRMFDANATSIVGKSLGPLANLDPLVYDGLDEWGRSPEPLVAPDKQFSNGVVIEPIILVVLEIQVSGYFPTANREAV